jgi:magnesium and cobalt exporter, CNNM family
LEEGDGELSYLLPLGFVVLVMMTSALGFSETVLNQMGVNRLSKLLAGERGDDEFTPEEQVSLLTAILMMRLFSLLALGGLAVVWTFDLNRGPLFEVGALLSLAFVLVLCETLARRHARSKAQRVAGRVLAFFRGLTKLFSPIVKLVFALTSPLAPAKTDPVASLEDLNDQILELQVQGVFKETQTEIFQSLLDFGDTIAREVMVPRVDMVCTKLGTPVVDVLREMHEHGFSRLPVYRDTIDDILGFVYVKDLIVALDDLDRPLSEEDIREVVVVPGTRKVGEILRDFQDSNRALALVLDEYGGTDGVLTVEDILEELVGEINDEYDQEVAEVEHQEDGTILLDAKMILEDVNETLSISIPTNGPETLGGYLYDKFGHAPDVGETVLVDDIKFAVEDVERNRITWVKVERLSADEIRNEREQVA